MTVRLENITYSGYYTSRDTKTSTDGNDARVAD